jgi:ABC-2 type transport system permease protein
MGHDVQADYRAARRLLGVVPQELVFDPFFTVRESLKIQSGYFGIGDNDAWIDEILENLDLTSKANTNMRMLSGGMKRRVLVAQALVHRPPVIVLDEPTAGVDVELRQALWHFIRRLNRRRPHHRADHALPRGGREPCAGASPCSRQGRIVALDTTANLLRRFSGHSLRLRTAARCLRHSLAAPRKRRLVSFPFPPTAASRAGAGEHARGRLRDRRSRDRQAGSGRGLRSRHAGATGRGGGLICVTAAFPPCSTRKSCASGRSLPDGGAPVLTALLYLLIFSHVLEGHVKVHGVAYTAFLVPGLVMMSVLQNAFANSSSSLIQSKVTGNIVFMLLPPISYLEFFAAYVLAAVVRGVVVGAGVLLATLWFADLTGRTRCGSSSSPCWAAPSWAALGVIAGIWADKFDQLAAFQNFMIMPLTFLSGVFYSIHSLPPFWQQVSHFNPVFYMIDGFRHGFFGVSDVSPWLSLARGRLLALRLTFLPCGC